MIVLSHEPETILVSSNWTQRTDDLCPLSVWMHLIMARSHTDDGKMSTHPPNNETNPWRERFRKQRAFDGFVCSPRNDFGAVKL